MGQHSGIERAARLKLDGLEAAVELKDLGVTRQSIRSFETALHWASRSGLLRLAQCLIERGADVKQRHNRFNAMPLGWVIHLRLSTPFKQSDSLEQIASLLVRARAHVELEWLKHEQIRGDPRGISILRGE